MARRCRDHSKWNDSKHLCVRHPASGRLVRCCRLPFGFIDSPRLFCGLTEGVAEIFRRRAADMATAEARVCGMHVLVFVDDFLVVGDSEELTRRAGELLEQILDELGLPYVIENVLGAASEMREHAIIIRGEDYGDQLEKPRFLEAGGGLVLSPSASLTQGGAELRERCCLGGHARYARLDKFGQRCSSPCCRGNIFAVMGDAPCARHGS